MAAEYKKFLFYFMEPDGSRYLTVQNGVVTPTSTPTHLSNTPDGWQELMLAWERDVKYMGLTRQVSLPFGFLTQAAQILRKAFFSESLERKIVLLITRLELDIDVVNSTYEPIYRLVYKGEIDSTSLEHSALKIEGSLVESGIAKPMAANRNTEYAFPLSEGDAVVKLDGMKFLSSARWLLLGISSATYNVPIQYLNREGASPYVFASSQDTMNVNLQSFLENVGDAPITYQLDIPLSFRPQQISSRLVEIRLYKTPSLTPVFQQDINPATNGQLYSFHITPTVTLNKGEGLNLFVRAVGPNNSHVDFVESTITASWKAKYQATFAKAYTPLALYRKLIKAVAGKPDYALSSLLVQYSNIKLTSGDGLRGLDSAKIKTSLETFLEFCRVNLFAGSGIENEKAVVESFGYFLNLQDPIFLGEVRNLSIREAKDLLFNTIKVGYAPFQTDDVNGKYAFANTYVFQAPITVVSKELNLVSPYTADPYAIELTRINLEGKTTTDDKGDNEVFLLDATNASYTLDLSSTGSTPGAINVIGFDAAGVDISLFPPNSTFTVSGAGILNGTYTVAVASLIGARIGLFVKEGIPTGNFPSATIAAGGSTLYRNPQMTITGVPDPETIFNIRLSPKRILMRWMPWINSVLYREAGSKITFVSTDKNDALQTVELGVVIEENAEVVIGTTRIFLNKELSFEAISPDRLPRMLQLGPNRPFIFTYNGDTITGFSLRAGLSPSDEKEQAFRLLSSPLNDFKNFIYG